MEFEAERNGQINGAWRKLSITCVFCQSTQSAGSQAAFEKHGPQLKSVFLLGLHSGAHLNSSQGHLNPPTSVPSCRADPDVQASPSADPNAPNSVQDPPIGPARPLSVPPSAATQSHWTHSTPLFLLPLVCCSCCSLCLEFHTSLLYPKLFCSALLCEAVPTHPGGESASPVAGVTQHSAPSKLWFQESRGHIVGAPCKWCQFINISWLPDWETEMFGLQADKFKDIKYILSKVF